MMALVSKMIYKYSELLKKTITNGKLFKIDFGLYSDKKYRILSINSIC